MRVGGGGGEKDMRFAFWITKATDTHSEYVIIIAFPLQPWYLECASMLRSNVHFICYNLDGVCLLRGTNSVFTCNSGYMLSITNLKYRGTGTLTLIFWS